jgi:hypothetical protein
VPNPRNFKQEALERIIISDDPVILEVPSKFEDKALVLLSDWKVPIRPAPFGHPL